MSALKLQKSPSAARPRLDLSWLNLALAFVALLLLVITAFWVARQAENTLEENLKSKLMTILGIESEAIKDWLESQMERASLLAENERLSDHLAALDLDSSQAVRAELTKELDRIAIQVGSTDCFVIFSDGVVLATNRQSCIAAEKLPPLEEGFRQRLISGQAAISKPFQPLPNQASERNSDESNSNMMIVAAPIRNAVDEYARFLCFGIRPLDSFSSILKSSRTGQTGETFVFDNTGRQFSALRFPSAAGFSNQVQGDSLVNRILQSSDSGRPQTTIDLLGYRDYRGDQSIGVGKWLPRYGFGVVTTMKRAEAKAPIVQIRRFLWLISALLMISMAFTFVYRWYIFRLGRAACAAELGRKQLGPYLLEEMIGEGGMGKVYRAKHALLRRPTAVKILPPEKSSPRSIARFEQEVHLTSQLKHPNTISIYDFGRTENGLFFYAMEYLEGIDLEKLVHKKGSIPAPRVVHILLQVCASLLEAHRQDLIHRDIKPANIMLCNRGGAADLVKVLDFGMVRDQRSEPDQRLDNRRRSNRSTSNGGLFGTPIYMAPEAFVDPVSVDRRADIYSVGAVGFFLLAGETLFEGQTFHGVMKHHLSGQEFAIEDLLREKQYQEFLSDKRLVQVIARCLASNPADRFQDVDQLRTELGQCDTAGCWNELQAAEWWDRFCLAQYNDKHEFLTRKGLAETLTFSTTGKSPCEIRVA